MDRLTPAGQSGKRPALITPVLKRGMDYWQSKCSGDRLPARQDIDPGEIKDLLPHIILSDVLPSMRHDEPCDYRFRLMGTHVEEHMSSRRSGLRLSEVLPRTHDSELWHNLDRVVESRRPQFHAVPYIGPHRDFKLGLDVILPLSEDGRSVSMLMSVVHFLTQPDFERIAIPRPA